MKTGYIEIIDKVRFVYHELEKPDPHKFWVDDQFYIECYFGRRKRYEASKQSVEVSNMFKFWETLSVDGKTNLKEVWMMNSETEYKNKQKCKAKVNGETAEIIELIK